MSSVQKFMLFIVVPAVLLSSFIEAAILSKKERYDFRAMGVSVLDLIGISVVSFVLPFSIATPLIDLVWRNRIATLQIDNWQTLLVLFVGQDFCYYWYHRAQHRVRWFWNNHSVHHTSNDLNMAAGYRGGWLGVLSGAPLFFLPLVWIGFSPHLVIECLALNLLYQFWIHTTWIPKLGWLEYFLNTPSAHRVHHATNRDYLNSNYGGVLIIFDRLFGTYKEEQQSLSYRYGLTSPMHSYNLFHIEFSQWHAMFRDLLKVRTAKALLGLFFMPPDWSQSKSRDKKHPMV